MPTTNTLDLDDGNDVVTHSPVSSTAPIKTKPDPATVLRIKALAEVGAALNSDIDDVTFESKYNNAKAALQRFQEGIEKLELDVLSQQGMRDLIELLSKEIEHKQQEAVNRGY